MYSQLGEGGIFLRLIENRLGLTEIAGVGHTCLYRLLGVLMSGLCLYYILTVLLYVHRTALLALPDLSPVVERIRGTGTAISPDQVHVYGYVLIHKQI